jgi:hypothetical protein
MAQRARQNAAGQDGFGKIILSTLLNGLGGQCIVIASGQDNNRSSRKTSVNGSDSIDALAVREAHIQQDGIESAGLQVLHPGTEPVGLFQHEILGADAEQLEFDQAGVAGIIFDEQNAQGHGRLQFRQRAVLRRSSKTIPPTGRLS